MKKVHLTACAALALAGLAGCQSRQAATVEATTASAGPVIKSTENYKQARFAEAMEGLEIVDGRVVVDREAARAIDPVDADEALASGRLLLEENDFKGAIGEFRRAILADEGRAEAYEALGDGLICEKKDEMALAAYATAAELAPGDAGIRMKLAETINRNGDVEGWAAELERVLAIEPENGEAHARLAVASYYMGDRERAREHAALAHRFGGHVPPQLEAMLTN